MTTKDISGMLETPEFPVEQTALLAYSGNARQRRKAWRKDSRLIIEASCNEAGVGTPEGYGKTIQIDDLVGHVCEVKAK